MNNQKKGFLENWKYYSKTEAIIFIILLLIGLISILFTFIFIFFHTERATLICLIISVISLVLFFYGLLKKTILKKESRRKAFAKIKKFFKYPIINVILVILVIGMSFWSWNRINNPPDYNGRNTFMITVVGKDKGQNNISTEIWINYEDIYPLGSKINVDRPDMDWPVVIHFITYNNFSVLFDGLDRSQIFYRTKQNVTAYNWSDEQNYEILWFRKDHIHDFIGIFFYLDGAITYPDARLFSLSLDMKYLDQSASNITVNSNTSLKLEGLEGKDVRIESANFHFIRYYDELVCENFPDTYRVDWWPDSEHTITNIDFDFSTQRSRIRYDSSLILLALLIEFPIIAILDAYKSWRDNGKHDEQPTQATTNTTNHSSASQTTKTPKKQTKSTKQKKLKKTKQKKNP